VDPEGCQDADDVFSWRTRGEVSEFAITIADVATLVPEGSETDMQAKQRGQTVYEEGRILASMLPKEVEVAGSLLADDVARPGLSLVWTLTPTEVSGPRWISATIRNQHTFTYDTIAESSYGPTLKGMLSRIVGPLSEDPHKWVEEAMIRYNVEAAMILSAANNGLLRRHKGLKSGCHLQALATSTGCEDLRFLGYAAGEYVSATEEEVAHVGLGKALYCHASSPLRRYADLVNQRVLKATLFQNWDTEPYAKGREEMPTLAIALNDRSKAIKALERGVWCLQTLSTQGICSGEGIVLGWKPGRLEQHWRLAVYVPTWKRTIRVTVFGAEHTLSWNPGDRVCVRAFCNQKDPRWEHRYVFTVAQGAPSNATEVERAVESGSQ
jgi:exoribonuclease R